MFSFKPLGYRVLAEMVGRRKLPTPIILPDKNQTEISAIDRWVVREIGDGSVSALTGERVEVTNVKIGDEIYFDARRCVEAMPPMLCGGKILAFVEVEGIYGIITGEPDPYTPKPSISIARSVPKIAA